MLQRQDRILGALDRGATEGYGAILWRHWRERIIYVQRQWKKQLCGYKKKKSNIITLGNSVSTLNYQQTLKLCLGACVHYSLCREARDKRPNVGSFC